MLSKCTCVRRFDPFNDTTLVSISKDCAEHGALKARVGEACEECGTGIMVAKELWQGGGIKCCNPSCNNWFCY